MYDDKGDEEILLTIGTTIEFLVRNSSMVKFDKNISDGR